MAKRYIESMMEKASEMFLEKGMPEEAKRVLSKKTYSPITKEAKLHPESKASNEEYNSIISSLVYDVDIINTEIANSAFLYSDLLKSAKERLENVERDIEYMRETRKDIQLLDCKEAVRIDPLDFDGDYSIVDGKMCSKIISEGYTKYEVIRVSGNGQEGNKSVYFKDAKDFLHKHIDTSKRSNLNDMDDFSVYEYERINVDKESDRAIPTFNVGWEEARCCIDIAFNNPANSIKILAEGNDIEIKDIETSNDGVSYKSQFKDSLFLGKGNKDSDRDYVKGSGILCFPSAKYARLYIQSVGYTDDTVAYMRHATREEIDV